MHNPEISFIILTLNEELHIQRLLDSVRPLNAETFVVDSGSTDNTLDICRANQVKFIHHDFENHPKQWHAALTELPISTPWVICLDADQVICSELLQKLMRFRAAEYSQVYGIYFNRKYIFKGKWIKHGGYYPKYLLKMFDLQHAYSDLQENMDHRFVVLGKTLCWSDGHLIEENLKENNIGFWISKHNTYSNLLAQEELERKQQLRKQSIKPNFFGSPDEKNAWQKMIWWQLPLFVRPFLYLGYRMIFRLGILDGKRGITYHFLQSFWFRLLVDIKIKEQLESGQKVLYNPSSTIFVFRFLILFSCFYGFHEAFIGLSTAGGSYLPLLNQFNYIDGWRHFNIQSAAYIIKLLGFQPHTTATSLYVTGRAGFTLIYSCLGYGMMSLTAAFIISFPKPRQSKMLQLFLCLGVIQLSNILRLVLIALYAKKQMNPLLDHHTIYNLFLYIMLSVITHLWLKHPIVCSTPRSCKNLSISKVLIPLPLIYASIAGTW